MEPSDAAVDSIQLSTDNSSLCWRLSTTTFNCTLRLGQTVTFSGEAHLAASLLLRDKFVLLAAPAEPTAVSQLRLVQLLDEGPFGHLFILISTTRSVPAGRVLWFLDGEVASGNVTRHLPVLRVSPSIRNVTASLQTGDFSFQSFVFMRNSSVETASSPNSFFLNVPAFVLQNETFSIDLSDSTGLMQLSHCNGTFYSLDNRSVEIRLGEVGLQSLRCVLLRQQNGPSQQPHFSTVLLLVLSNVADIRRNPLQRLSVDENHPWAHVILGEKSQVVFLNSSSIDGSYFLWHLFTKTVLTEFPMLEIFFSGVGLWRVKCTLLPHNISWSLDVQVVQLPDIWLNITPVEPGQPCSVAILLDSNQQAFEWTIRFKLGSSFTNFSATPQNGQISSTHTFDRVGLYLLEAFLFIPPFQHFLLRNQTIVVVTERLIGLFLNASKFLVTLDEAVMFQATVLSGGHKLRWTWSFGNPLGAIRRQGLNWCTLEVAFRRPGRFNVSVTVERSERLLEVMNPERLEARLDQEIVVQRRLDEEAGLRLYLMGGVSSSAVLFDSLVRVSSSIRFVVISHLEDSFYCEFDFGDGSTSQAVLSSSSSISASPRQEAVVVYRYLKEGHFQVNAIVYNDVSQWKVPSLMVMVLARPGDLSFFDPEYSVAVNTEINFTVSLSSGYASSVLWQLGDGTTQSSTISQAGDTQTTLFTVRHEYANPGVYLVRAIASNEVGKSETTVPLCVQSKLSTCTVNAVRELWSTEEDVLLNATYLPAIQCAVNRWIIRSGESKNSEMSVNPSWTQLATSISFRYSSPGLYVVETYAQIDSLYVACNKIQLRVLSPVRNLRVQFFGKDTALVGEQVNFSALYYSGSQLNFWWFVDSVNISSGRYFVHTFTREARYRVSVRAENIFSSDTAFTDIFVLNNLCDLPHILILPPADATQKLLRRTKTSVAHFFAYLSELPKLCAMSDGFLYSWNLQSDSLKQNMILNNCVGQSCLISAQNLEIGNYSLFLRVSVRNTILYQDVATWFQVVDHPLRVSLHGGFYRKWSTSQPLVLYASWNSLAAAAVYKWRWTCFALYDKKDCFQVSRIPMLNQSGLDFISFAMWTVPSSSWRNDLILDTRIVIKLYLYAVTADDRLIDSTSASQVVHLMALTLPADDMLRIVSSSEPKAAGEMTVTADEDVILRVDDPTLRCGSAGTLCVFEWRLYLVEESWNPPRGVCYLSDKIISWTLREFTQDETSPATAPTRKLLQSAPFVPPQQGDSSSVAREGNGFPPLISEGSVGPREPQPSPTSLTFSSISSPATASPNGADDRSHVLASRSTILMIERGAQVLSIKKRTLFKPGRRYLISVDVHRPSQSGASVNRSIISLVSMLRVRRGPESGLCSVSPIYGQHLVTRFMVSCRDWRSSESSSALRYRISYWLGNDASHEEVGSEGFVSFQDELYLPVGPLDPQNQVNLRVSILDEWNSMTNACLVTLNVSDLPINETILQIKSLSLGSDSQLARRKFGGDSAWLRQTAALIWKSVNAPQMEKLSDAVLCDRLRLSRRMWLLVIADLITDVQVDYMLLVTATQRLTSLQDCPLDSQEMQAVIGLVEGLVSHLSTWPALVDTYIELLANLVDQRAINSSIVHLIDKAIQIKLLNDEVNPTPFSLRWTHSSFQVELLDVAEAASLNESLTLYLSETQFALPASLLAQSFREGGCAPRALLFSVPSEQYGFFPAHLGQIVSPVVDLTLHTCTGRIIEVSHSTHAINITFLQNWMRNEKKYDFSLLRGAVVLHEFNITDELRSQSLHLLIEFQQSNAAQPFPIALEIHRGNHVTRLAAEDALILRSYAAAQLRILLFFPNETFAEIGSYTLLLYDKTELRTARSTVELASREYRLRMWTHSCIYWQAQVGWASTGCRALPSTESLLHLRCACHHLTAFAAPVRELICSARYSRIADFLQHNINYTVVAFCVALITLLLLVLPIAWKKDCRRSPLEPLLLLDSTASDRQWYELYVDTDVSYGAGTTAKVFVVLHGTEGILETRELTALAVSHGSSRTFRDLFRSGRRDRFLLSYPESVGAISKLHVWHDNSGISPSWLPRQFVLRDICTGSVARFSCQQWLSASAQLSTRVDVLLSPSIEPLTFHQNLMYYWNVSISTLCPPWSVFGRPDWLGGSHVSALLLCMAEASISAALTSWCMAHGIIALDEPLMSDVISNIRSDVTFTVLQMVFLLAISSFIFGTIISLLELLVGPVRFLTFQHPSAASLSAAKDCGGKEHAVEFSHLEGMRRHLEDQPVHNLNSIKQWAQDMWETRRSKETLTTMLNRSTLDSSSEDHYDDKDYPSNHISHVQGSGWRLVGLNCDTRKLCLMAAQIGLTLVSVLVIGAGLSATLLYGMRLSTRYSVPFLTAQLYSGLLKNFLLAPVLTLCVLLARHFTRLGTALQLYRLTVQACRKMLYETFATSFSLDKHNAFSSLDKAVNARQRSRYLRFTHPPSPQLLQRSRRLSLRARQTLRFVLRAAQHTFVLTVLLILVVLNTPTSHYRLHDSFRHLLLPSMQSSKLQSRNAINDSTFNSFICPFNHILLHAIEPCDLKLCPIANTQSWRVGGLLLRLWMRNLNESCSAQQALKTYEKLHWNGRICSTRKLVLSKMVALDDWWEVRNVFGNRSDTVVNMYDALLVMPVFGHFSIYSKLDQHHIFLNGSLADTLRGLKMFQPLTSHVSAVALEMNLYSPAMDLYTSVRLLVEGSLVGSTKISFYLDSVQLANNSMMSFLAHIFLILILVTRAYYFVVTSCCSRPGFCSASMFFPTLMIMLFCLFGFSYLGFQYFLHYGERQVQDMFDLTQYIFYVDLSFVCFVKAACRVLIASLLLLEITFSLRLLRNIPVFKVIIITLQTAQRSIMAMGLIFTMCLLIAFFTEIAILTTWLPQMGTWILQFIVVPRAHDYNAEKTDSGATLLRALTLCIWFFGFVVLRAYFIAIFSKARRTSRLRLLDAPDCLESKPLPLSTTLCLLCRQIRLLMNFSREREFYKLRQPVSEPLSAEFILAELQYQIDEMLYRIARLSGDEKCVENSSTTFEKAYEDVRKSWSEPLIGSFFDQSVARDLMKMYGSNFVDYKSGSSLHDLSSIQDCHLQNWRNFQSQLEVEIFRQLQLSRCNTDLNSQEKCQSIASLWSHSSADSEQPSAENKEYFVAAKEINVVPIIRLDIANSDCDEWIEMDDLTLDRTHAK